jgi:DNA (cytosine-5)-methyltransferase 1
MMRRQSEEHSGNESLLPLGLELDQPPTESYDLQGKEAVRRHVTLRNGKEFASTVNIPKKSRRSESAFDAYDSAWLKSSRPPLDMASRPTRVNTVDLFCGCGAMSLGLWEACRAVGKKMNPALAVDLIPEAAEIYNRNFQTDVAVASDIGKAVNGPLGGATTAEEKRLLSQISSVDFLIGGPPCQGHSDLNNHTRRSDPKNQLILQMARFAELTEPDHVIIENVQGARHDRLNAAGKAKAHLLRLGYHVDEGLLLGSTLGVPQTRRRFFIVASKKTSPDLRLFQKINTSPPRTLWWACSDLESFVVEGDTFNSPAKHAAQNVARIDYLFTHGLHDLPDSQRPDCHRLKPHDYRAVYGRLYADRPAPTMTTGFGSTGQGRFVHPTQRRTLTPHEAARLQFIPDFFDLSGLTRRHLQTFIGNAVPPKMLYVLAKELLR